VAELCIGTLLALLRRLPQADRYVRDGRWKTANFPLATSLAGKHVGIVGMGRIGKEIARRLEMFGVALAYHGRTDQGLAWRYEADLAALARDSDILILVAPGGAETRHLVDARVLEALGPTGYLVNVARVRRRAGHRSALLRARQRDADAAPGQRHARDACRDGAADAGQRAGIFPQRQGTDAGGAGLTGRCGRGRGYRAPRRAPLD